MIDAIAVKYYNDEEREKVTLRKIGCSYYVGIRSYIQKRRNITKKTLLDYDIVKVVGFYGNTKFIVYDEKIYRQPMSKYRDINPRKFGKYYYLPIKKSTVDFYRLKSGYIVVIRIFNIRNPEGEGDAGN